MLLVLPINAFKESLAFLIALHVETNLILVKVGVEVLLPFLRFIKNGHS